MFAMANLQQDDMSVGHGCAAGAVIYEDAYEDSPGVWRDRRSTRVRLDVSASGGPRGGTLSLSSQNLGKLSPVACGPLALPSLVPIAAGGIYGVSFLCEAAEHSASQDDVWVRGVFTENDTGESFTNAAALTVVKVELRPNVVAPENDRVYRHSYGVCELVQHLQQPSAPTVTWNPVGGGSNEVHAGSAHYRCPLFGCENPLRAEVEGVHYSPKIEVVEPQGMSSKAIEPPIVYSNAVHVGEAGGVGMKLYLYVKPLDVSFSQIAVEEVPCSASAFTATGYFNNPYYDNAFGHTPQAGAGRWGNVGLDNKFGDHDETGYTDKVPWLTPGGLETNDAAYAWTDGEVYIDHPFGWNVYDTTGDTLPYRRFGEDTRVRILLDVRGKVGMFKLDNWVERSTNGMVRLWGPRDNER